MARVKLSATYESRVEEEPEVPAVVGAFREFNKTAEETTGHRNAVMKIWFSSLRPYPFHSGSLLRWEVSEEFDTEISRPQDAELARQAISSAASQFESAACEVLRRTPFSIQGLAGPMRKSLETGACLAAEISAPLRHGDLEAIGSDPMAFVEVALGHPFPFIEDRRRQLGGMTAVIRGSDLLISGGSPRAVGLAAAAAVGAPRPVELPPSKVPYWAYGSVAIMAVSFALCWLRLSVGSLTALGAATAATALAIILPARRRRLVRVTVIGMVPALTVIAFAIVYGIAASTGGTVALPGEPLHLRDALLLSLSLGSTVGLLDLTVTGWLRSIAYLEMLLVASYLGTAAVVAARSFSVRLDRAMRRLQLEQDRG